MLQTWFVASLLLAAAVPGGAMASDLSTAQPGGTSGASAGPASSATDAFGAALAGAQLDAARGGQSTTYGAISDQVLSAVDSGNAINANAVTSGMVNLQSGAFSGFNGIGNFVINTGNNNSLQGSLSVTVVLAPASH